MSSESVSDWQFVETDAGSTMYIAGQGATGPQKGMRGKGDYLAQVQQAFKNVAAVVAAGASPRTLYRVP